MLDKESEMKCTHSCVAIGLKTHDTDHIINSTYGYRMYDCIHFPVSPSILSLSF